MKLAHDERTLDPKLLLRIDRIGQASVGARDRIAVRTSALNHNGYGAPPHRAEYAGRAGIAREGPPSERQGVIQDVPNRELRAILLTENSVDAALADAEAEVQDPLNRCPGAPARPSWPEHSDVAQETKPWVAGVSGKPSSGGQINTGSAASISFRPPQVTFSRCVIRRHSTGSPFSANQMGGGPAGYRVQEPDVTDVTRSLMRACCKWRRAEAPRHPLTVAASSTPLSGSDEEPYQAAMNRCALNVSDIITFDA